MRQNFIYYTERSREKNWMRKKRAHIQHNTCCFKRWELCVLFGEAQKCLHSAWHAGSVVFVVVFFLLYHNVISFSKSIKWDLICAMRILCVRTAYTSVHLVDRRLKQLLYHIITITMKNKRQRIDDDSN